MKLLNLDLVNFRSYHGVTLALDAPRVLIAGLNGTGKTSVREAIQWILTGHCDVTDGKGAGAEVLVPTGQKAAEATVTVDEIGRVSRHFSPSLGGAVVVEGFTGTSQVQQQALLIKLKTTPQFLDAVLSTDVFLNLGHAEAKAMVLSLLGVKIKNVQIGFEGDTPVVKDLTLDELDLRYKQAFENRKSAKRALQGFTVGPKPVEQQMPTIEMIEAQLGRLRATLGEHREAIGTAVGSRKALAAEVNRLTITLNTPVPPDMSEKIAELEKWLGTLEAEAVPAEAPAPSKGDPARAIWIVKRITSLKEHLPSKGCVLDADVPCRSTLDDFGARLEALRGELKAVAPATPQAPQQPLESPLTARRRELADLQWQQQKRIVNFEAVRQANARAQAIRQEIDALPDTAVQEGQIAELQTRISKGEELLRNARLHWAAVESYGKAVSQQGTLKADVDRLEALCDQLGPKGVRVEALAQAVNKFESAVNPYIEPFGWKIGFSVEPWEVSANGRPVESYSRSERYRIGIALQLGIAKLSGLNFAVVDEVDMLDVSNRQKLSAMLIQAPLEQILILGTREAEQALKAPKGVIAYRLSKNGDQSVISEVNDQRVSSMSETVEPQPKTWPERRVVRTGVSPMNPLVKWAELTCGHLVWRQRKPRIGATIVCDQCSEPSR